MCKEQNNNNNKNNKKKTNEPQRVSNLLCSSNNNNNNNNFFYSILPKALTLTAKDVMMECIVSKFHQLNQVLQRRGSPIPIDT
jgi:hypothetical protein